MESEDHTVKVMAISLGRRAMDACGCFRIRGKPNIDGGGETGGAICDGSSWLLFSLIFGLSASRSSSCVAIWMESDDDILGLKKEPRLLQCFSAAEVGL